MATSRVSPEGASAVDRAVEAARSRIAPRVSAESLAGEVASGALVVDIRPEEQRLRDGTMPDVAVIGRNVLEWRLDPTSEHRSQGMDDPQRRIILVCDEGYASSLAAAGLVDLGLTNVTDLVGGYQAWRRLESNRS